MKYLKYGLGIVLIIGLLTQTLQAVSDKTSCFMQLLVPAAGMAEATTSLPENPSYSNYRFTVPPGLREKVDFWKMVYTGYTSDQVIIHDKEHLNVIYTVLDFSYLKNGKYSYRTQKRIERKKTAETKRKYRAILRKLAKPNLKLDRLSAEEKRVYELFLPIKEHNKFNKAGGRRRIRCQVGQSDRFIKGLKSSGLYIREIEKIFAYYKLPQELTLLPFVESFFNPNAHSNDGAVGIWQFIRSTGRYYLKINSVIDERRDPYKASTAAAKLLRNNYKKLGSWPLAITAYNHGSAGMQRAKRKTGRADLVGIIEKYRSRKFGFASKNFYAEFLAVLEIVPNHDRYFGKLRLKPSWEFDEVKLPHYVSVQTLVKHCLLDKRDIKSLNPALKTSILNSRKYIPKGYPLRIPAGAKDSFLKSYAQIPRKLQYAAQKRDNWHRVSWGETLSQIARRYRTTVSALVDLNNLSSSRYIRTGQRLRIPQTGYKPGRKKTTRIAKAKTRAKPTKKAKVKKPTAPIQLAKADVGFALIDEPEKMGSIIVKPHESIGYYADWARVSASSVRRLNGLSYRQRIHVGQAIEINYAKVGKQEFEDKRGAFHRRIQQDYLDKYKIERIQKHVIKPRQNVWYLCRYEYKVPLWLVEKYNQDKNLTQLNVGDTLFIPIVSRKL